MDNIFDRLKKHGISQDRYDQQSKELLHLGFSKDQAQKIIIKKFSNNVSFPQMCVTFDNL